MTRLRAASFEDAAAIRMLNQRNAMGDLDPVLWREGWESYPFAAEFRDVPTGWVLEADDGSVVGNLDNIQLLYEMGGRRIKGAIAAGWLVDPAHRGKSLNLLTAFLRQKGIDLCLIDSAAMATAQILTAMKIARIPLPDYGVPCFWAVRPRAFAKAVLLRRSVPGAALLAWPAGLALLARDVYRRSGRGRIGSKVRRLAGFDEHFDELWERIGAASARLRAIRTRAVLEWRFRSELRTGQVDIVAAERDAQMVGYAILVRREVSGMDLYDVADLQAVGDETSIVTDLLLGSIDVAREEGADAVKFMTGIAAKQAAANALRPYTYRASHWQLYFKPATAELGSLLSGEDAWDLSWFDTF
jgi:hypothetical protein